ncbi:MAG: hypothetical protein R3C11_01355 [Planctomycetaceae bacterium]
MRELKSGNFGVYDLFSLDVAQATAYLTNKHHFERQLEEGGLHQHGVTFTEGDVGDVIALFENLSRNFAGVGTTDRESLISTPLLMHFVSILPPGTLTSDSTLYDLYNAVINQHLDREINSRSHTRSGISTPNEELRQLALVAMTRIALAIQSQGADATRLPPKLLSPLLTSPRNDPQTGQTPGWWPADTFCHSSPVHTQFFPTSSQNCGSVSWDKVISFSLLKQTDEGVSFNHDSLIYFFCGAVALVEYEVPGRTSRCGDDWCQHVIARFKERTDIWVKPAPFLAHRLQTIDVLVSKHSPNSTSIKSELLLQLVRHGRTEDWFDLLNLYSSSLKNGDELFAIIWRAMHNHPGYLRQYPDDLPAEIARYLLSLPERSDRLQNFLDHLLRQK